MEQNKEQGAMELNINDNVKQLISFLILVILPLLIILVEAIFGVKNVLYYLLPIVWAGMGIILYGAIE